MITSAQLYVNIQAPNGNYFNTMIEHEDHTIQSNSGMNLIAKLLHLAFITHLREQPQVPMPINYTLIIQAVS